MLVDLNEKLDVSPDWFEEQFKREKEKWSSQ